VNSQRANDAPARSWLAVTRPAPVLGNVRRIAQALGEAGIAEAIRAELRPGEAAERAAVLALARKRRFGPFGSAPLDRPAREKQLAALLRAGHRLDSAREIVDASSAEAAEQWAAEADDEEV